MTDSAPVALSVSGAVLVGGSALRLPSLLAVTAVAATACVLHGAWLVRLAVAVRRDGNLRASKAGCRYGQGYIYGKPGPAERVEAELVHQPIV